MIQLTLKDGSIRELEAPTAAAEVIKGIGMGLYKAACCVKLDGEVCDLRTVIDHDCTFEVMTFDSEEGKALLQAWGLPETLRGVGSIALGYPAGAINEAAKRKDGYIVRV